MVKKKNLHEQIKSILDVFQPANSFSLNDFPWAATATKGFEARREKKMRLFSSCPCLLPGDTCAGYIVSPEHQNKALSASLQVVWMEAPP